MRLCEVKCSKYVAEGTSGAFIRVFDVISLFASFTAAKTKVLSFIKGLCQSAPSGLICWI